MLILYGLFVFLTFVALLVSRWVKARHNIQLQSALLSPLGSLYTLTTAFLLSNVIFQFTNLRAAITQEVVTISKLGAVMSVLPPEQRVEARRLLYDYTDTIAHDESETMRLGDPSEKTELASDRLRNFLATVDATPPATLPKTPESINYFRKVSDFGFDLVDARERRLSLNRQTFPNQLWLAIGIMFFALALVTFLVHSGVWTTLWAAIILLLAAPVPAIMLYIYSNPVAMGLIDIASLVEAVMERSRG